MRYLLLLAVLASCSTTKHVDRQTTTTDSTWQNERRSLLEANEAMARKIETLVTDSQAVVVQFDTLTIRDTFTRNIVKFKDGKIVYVEGNIRRVQATADRSERRADSLQTLAYILQDSLDASKGKVRVVEKVVTRDVKRGWQWWWLVVGIVAGWAARHNWPVVRYRLFGK